MKEDKEIKHFTYRGEKLRITSDFSSEIMQARRDWSEIFKVLKEKTHQPTILYPVKLSFKSDREIKTFLDKQKLREFVASRLALQEMLKKKVLLEEEK